MRLVLDLGGNEIEFTEPLSGSLFPYLLEVGELRIAARAGYISGLGVGESPSLAVTLDNASNRAADAVLGVIVFVRVQRIELSATA